MCVFACVCVCARMYTSRELSISVLLLENENMVKTPMIQCFPYFFRLTTFWTILDPYFVTGQSMDGPNVEH